MFSRWKRKKVLVCIVFLFPFIIFQVSDINKLNSESPIDKYYDDLSDIPVVQEVQLETTANQSDLVRIVNFDPEKHWIVFFHIQKTSGTNYDLETVSTIHYKRDKTYQRACKNIKVLNTKITKRTVYMTEYSCKRNNSNMTWLFSWHENSFGWQCGLHPYLVDLRECIQSKIIERANNENKTNMVPLNRQDLKDKVFHISMIRDPITRFVSEYLHVKKTGSIWVYEQPPASKGHECAHDFGAACLGRLKSWKGVGWDTFVRCMNNLAFNRQTTMLAEYDASFSMCRYFKERSKHGINKDHERELLQRAIKGLHSLTFFGLTEYQNYSKLLMEKTFNGKFKYKQDESLIKLQSSQKSKSQTGKYMRQLSRYSLQKIKESNQLDVELYAYAKELFMKRLKHFNILPQDAKL